MTAPRIRFEVRTVERYALVVGDDYEIVDIFVGYSVSPPPKRKAGRLSLLNGEAAELRRRLDTHEDTERLDWLEARGTRLRRAEIGSPWRCIQADGRFTEDEIASDRYGTAREAIDAARLHAAEPQGNES